MKRVVITGVAGFIGSHAAEALLKRKKKVEVIGIDNLDANYSVSLKKENLSLLKKYPNFTFYKADIRNAKKMEDIFALHKPDAVLHIAAKTDTRHAVVAPTEYITTNVVGTLNLLEAAKNQAVKRFVFISSSSVYGNKNKPPFIETGNTDYAISPYGASKKAGEMLAFTYNHNFNLPVICLRVFNAYGPRMRPGLVLYRWVSEILEGKTIEMSGTGVRKRGFTYIDDLVDAIIRALENTTISYDVMNVGNTDTISLNRLLKIVEKKLGVKATVRSRPSTRPSVEQTHASTLKAKKLLGWQPTTSIEDGIEQFVLWFRNERVKKAK